ncbi:hypothetical protein HMPREF0102_00680 [Bacteroides sp. 2_1_22]|jgi:hypothetical protein|nr:hypothetical protein HMPREF0102_00680 [Bacteroides sp. 2_1_22]CDM00681.1 hypothetical protein BN891_36060 [Bacteroides xylanisolvens SD CC 2a]
MEIILYDSEIKRLKLSKFQMDYLSLLQIAVVCHQEELINL